MNLLTPEFIGTALDKCYMRKIFEEYPSNRLITELAYYSLKHDSLSAIVIAEILQSRQATVQNL